MCCVLSVVCVWVTYILQKKSNGQNWVHPEAQWPKPGTPFYASPRAPSYWPTPAQTRLWPNFKRVHPILAAHPPIGYPISITPTRLWPGYSTSSPHAHASSRHRGTRRVIFAVDVVVRTCRMAEVYRKETQGSVLAWRAASFLLGRLLLLY